MDCDCYKLFPLVVVRGTCRLAADIVPGRLESAKLVGADVVINCKEENLKERGEPLSKLIIITCNCDNCDCVRIKVFQYYAASITCMYLVLFVLLS